MTRFRTTTVRRFETRVLLTVIRQFDNVFDYDSCYFVSATVRLVRKSFLRAMYFEKYVRPWVIRQNVAEKTDMALVVWPIKTFDFGSPVVDRTSDRGQRPNKKHRLLKNTICLFIFLFMYLYVYCNYMYTN